MYYTMMAMSMQVWLDHQTYLQCVESSNHCQTIDVKPNSILVNYGPGEMRFCDAELATVGVLFMLILDMRRMVVLSARRSSGALRHISN
jgi:hypothetical protein